MSAHDTPKSKSMTTVLRISALQSAQSSSNSRHDPDRMPEGIWLFNLQAPATHPRPCCMSSWSACRWPPGSSPARCRGPAWPPPAAQPPALAADGNEGVCVQSGSALDKFTMHTRWCCAQSCKHATHYSLVLKPMSQSAAVLCDTSQHVRGHSCAEESWCAGRTWKYCV